MVSRALPLPLDLAPKTKLQWIAKDFKGNVSAVKSQVLGQTSSVLGFLLAAVSMYTAFALLMEDSRGREVLPVGRLGAARQATHGNLADELRNIERQPGVRRTL